MAFIGRVFLKALLLLLAANLVFALLNPLPALGRISLYNSLFPGRPRLPFGETPDRAYNFSLFSLDAMFASHEINRPKAPDEYRVVVVGDSSVWGILLKPEETLAGLLNARGIKAPDGRRLVFYNLGYPTISLAKDLMVLTWVRRYQPDAIVWLTTLESFPRDKQTASPILQRNPAAVRQLIQDYHLNLDPHDPALQDPTFWGRTLFGERRALADLFRLQLYGVSWAATGIDQYYPPTYERWANDLAADPTFHGLPPPHLLKADLSLDVLQAGMSLFPGKPVLLVNEPMAVSSGENHEIRYNFFYPRWAYDDYRQILLGLAQEQGWNYLDLWDAVPPAQFTNSAIHLTPEGEGLLAEKTGAALQSLLAGKRLAVGQPPAPATEIEMISPAPEATSTLLAPTPTRVATAIEATLPPILASTPVVTATALAPEVETSTPTPGLDFKLIFAGNILKRLDTTDPVVILTIDDGLRKQALQEMLVILQEAGVKATFFLTGYAIEYRLGADLMKTLAEQGYEIGYHSVAHLDMNTISTWDTARWSQDYDEWVTILQSTLGSDLYARAVRPYARAPFGLFTKAFLDMCAQKHLEPVGWSCNRNCLLKGSKLSRGDIFILHVSEEDVSPLKELIKRSFRLVPLSAVLPQQEQP